MKTLTLDCAPDLAQRPFETAVEKALPLTPAQVYQAWTQDLDAWFAVPGALVMDPMPGRPFFFEVRHEGHRHPHYGRFLELEPARLIVLTWLTKGTKGVETVLTLALEPEGKGTRIILTHAGFPDQDSCDQHAAAWPHVLEQMMKAFPAAVA